MTVWICSCKNYALAVSSVQSVADPMMVFIPSVRGVLKPI